MVRQRPVTVRDNLRADLFSCPKPSVKVMVDVPEGLEDTNRGVSSTMQALTPRVEAIRARQEAAAKVPIRLPLRTHRPPVRTSQPIPIRVSDKSPTDILEALEDSLFTLEKDSDAIHAEILIQKERMNSYLKKLGYIETASRANVSNSKKKPGDILFSEEVKVLNQDARREAIIFINLQYHQLLKQLEDEIKVWTLRVKTVEEIYKLICKDERDIWALLDHSIQLRHTAESGYETASTQFQNNKATRLRYLKLAKKGNIKSNSESGPKATCEDRVSGNQNQSESEVNKPDPCDSDDRKEYDEMVKEFEVKLVQLKEYEVMAEELTGSFEVPDLKMVPRRIDAAFHVRDVLHKERGILAEAKYSLLLNTYHTMMVNDSLTYTGHNRILAQEAAIKVRLAKIKDAVKSSEPIEREMEKITTMLMDTHLAIVGMNDTLNFGKSKSKHPPEQTFTSLFNQVILKLGKLSKRVKDLREVSVKSSKDKKGKFQRLVTTAVTQRSCRLPPDPDMLGDDEDDDDRDLELIQKEDDAKVPEVKARKGLGVYEKDHVFTAAEIKAMGLHIIKKASPPEIKSDEED